MNHHLYLNSHGELGMKGLSSSNALLLGVETNTHAFDADPIGYWTKILLGDRMYAFVRQNKCVTFEERRDRA